MEALLKFLVTFGLMSYFCLPRTFCYRMYFDAPRYVQGHFPSPAGNFNYQLPPPGSRGTIDFRYPDEIVEHLPRCTSEGVFPHPLNCTWYYRCFSYEFSEGFFHREIFECEPGTSFNDVLDQCTWGRNSICDGTDESTSNGTPESTATTTAPPYSTSTEENITPTEQNTTTSELYQTPTTQYTTTTTLYPPTTSQDTTTKEESSTGGSITINPCSCNVVTSNCENFEVCPNNGPQESMFLCQDVAVTCVLRDNCQPLPSNPCSEDQVFSPMKKDCLPAPSDPYFACNVTAPPPPPPPCDDCSFSYRSCREYEVCPTKNQKVKMILCSEAMKTCEPCGSRDVVCEGEYFSFQESECYPSPDSPTMTCEAQSTTEDSSNAIIDATNQITCSNNNRIPNDEWIQKQYCEVYPLCSEGLYLGITKLCTNYYLCTRQEGEWKAVLQECPPGLLYSFEEDRCSPKPAPEEICG